MILICVKFGYKCDEWGESEYKYLSYVNFIKIVFVVYSLVIIVCCRCFDYVFLIILVEW